MFCSNHPVHISDETGNLNPSTFIPFCELGVNMSSMGVMLDQFDVPVCNKFKARILNGQCCYEVDPIDFKDSIYDIRDLKMDLTLLIDYNEDRQFIFDSQINSSERDIYGQFIELKNEAEVMIHMDTIGKIF